MKRYLILVFLLASINLFSLGNDKELYTQAEREYLNGNYQLALEDYNEFVKEYPLSDFLPDVQYRRAVTLFRLGQYEESLQLFREIEKRFRTTRYFDYVPFWEGIILYNLKRYSNSVDALDAFLAIAGKDKLVPKAILFKSLSYYHLKLYGNAEEGLKELLRYEDFENRDYAIVLLFDVLLKEKKYNEILDYSKSLTADDFPRYLKSQYETYLAEALMATGMVKEAKRYYEKLAKESPETASFAIRRLFNIAQKENNLTEMERLTQLAEAKLAGNFEELKDFWIRIGIESYRNNNLELAKHFLMKVWTLKNIGTLIPAVPLYLSEILIKENKITDARDILKSYLEKAKRNEPSIVMRLGDVYLMLGDYTSAGKYYSLYMEENPDSGRFNEAAYLLAYTYYKSDKLKESLDLTESILANLHEGPYYQYTLKLQAVILMREHSYRKARGVLQSYLRVRPDDMGARMDSIKAAFLLKKYGEALGEVEELFRFLPDLKERDVKSYVLANYFGGLSSIVEKKYSTSIKYLSGIREKDLSSTGLMRLYPYVLYYTGWAYYRLGDFRKALEVYKFFAEHYKDHYFYENAIYMAGWCSFTLNDYTGSIGFFNLLAAASEKKLRVKAAFLKAKALLNMKKLDEAEKAFEAVFSKYPESNFADDALFDYSEILSREGKIEEAASGYMRLAKNYPASPLVEESYYRRAEMYFANGMYKKAKEAFYDYRVKYPRGRLMDAALYWGGYAAFKIGEKFGAALLWEKLISSYKGSPFRPDALAKTAEIYSSNGDYKRALDLYTELIASNPKEAELLGAREKADKLRYLILGLSEKEAQLSAIIGSKGGAKSREGREAMIELARIYIMEENKMELAYRLLQEVIAKDDKETKSKAMYLLGEYYYRKNELIEAGNTFLKAAFINPEDRDLMAVSIYRAAVMMKLARKYDDMRELVKRLEENFPSTQWAEDGKKLLEGIQ